MIKDAHEFALWFYDLMDTLLEVGIIEDKRGVDNYDRLIMYYNKIKK